VTFEELADLLERDPGAYTREISRLRSQHPSRFEEFVDWSRGELARAGEEDDRPLNTDEVEQLIDLTCKELGWSRPRVLSEAVLRLRAEIGTPRFSPVTPEEGSRAGRYLRRRSSVRALVLGDIKALLEKHGRS
jgi:hypothetical protein